MQPRQDKDNEKEELSFLALLKKSKPFRKLYDTFDSIKGVIWQSVQLAGSAILFGANIFPPLGCAIRGFLTILQAIEIVAYGKEALEIKALIAMNSAIALSVSIASFVLALNPATALTGLALIAASTAVNTIKEGFLWYRYNKDLAAAFKNTTEIIPEITAKRDKAKKSCFYSALSCLGSGLALLSALAVAGAIVANPLALGIVGLGIATFLTYSGIKDRYFSSPATTPVTRALTSTTESKKEPLSHDNEPNKDKSPHHPESEDTIAKLLGVNAGNLKYNENAEKKDAPQDDKKNEITLPSSEAKNEEASEPSTPKPHH